MSFNKLKISDFIEFNPKLTLKKGSKARKIPMEYLAPFQRDVVSNLFEPYEGGAKFQNNDTIVARITPSLENGKTAFIKGLKQNEIAYGSTEFIVLRAIEGISIPKFVYYFSTSSLFRDNAISSMTGTSGRQRVQEQVLHDISFDLPSLKEQKAIANILSSLDDKIELNNKINKNLEELAQTLYKRWFVDFEFPNENGEPYKSSGGVMVESELGLIPKGWNVLKLDDKFVFERGIEPGSKNYLDKKNLESLAFYRVGDLDQKSNVFVEKRFLKEKFVKEDETLVSFDGAIGRVGIGFEGSYSSGLRKIHDKSKEINKAITYFIMKSDSVQDIMKAHANGTTILHAGSSIPFLKIPYDKNTYANYNSKITPIFFKLIAIIKENKKLIKLRDLLLPKLMSGEIEVPIGE